MEENKKIKKLSIVVPVFNEKNTLELILQKLETADLGEVQKEIIIVDDCSSDGTRDILKNFEKKYTVIYHNKNSGKGAAVRTGFSRATGDYVVIQDADLEYNPLDFKKMIDFINTHNADVVYGSRRLDRHITKNKKSGWGYFLGGVFLSVLTNWLYGTKITDEPTCYKMIRKSVLDKLELTSQGFEICPELTSKIARLNIKINEVPIYYTPRSVAEGKKIRLKDGLIAVWTLIKYRFMR